MKRGLWDSERLALALVMSRQQDAAARCIRPVGASPPASTKLHLPCMPACPSAHPTPAPAPTAAHLVLHPVKQAVDVVRGAELYRRLHFGAVRPEVLVLRPRTHHGAALHGRDGIAGAWARSHRTSAPRTGCWSSTAYVEIGDGGNARADAAGRALRRVGLHAT